MDSWLYEEGEGEHQHVLPTQTDYYPPSLYMRNHITLIVGSHYYAFRHLSCKIDNEGQLLV